MYSEFYIVSSIINIEVLRRKTSVAKKAKRLFPSTNGRFTNSDSKRRYYFRDAKYQE